MNFEVTHGFDAAPDVVASVILDRAFQETLSDVGRLAERTVLSQQETGGGKVVRRTRCVLDIDVSGPAKRFIGDKDPAWVEVAEWDPEEMTWTWAIEPEVAGDLLEAFGITRLTPNGKGTVRTTFAEVKVKVPFYGGRVEGWIAEGLRSAYEEEAERLRAFLAR